MEQIRKPFQGVLNIIRFNWHLYVLAFVFILFLVLIGDHFDKDLKSFFSIVCILISLSIIISLLVSLYIYDLSGLYDLKWIGNQGNEKVILNINAGFDETSDLLKEKFYNSELIVLDFFDPIKHTEISIKRARKAYPPYPGTKQIVTTHLKIDNNSADNIFLILAAHEIRNENERIDFFKELNRIIKPTGQIYVTEHLRDVTNFIAYNIGFLHFYSKKSWLHTFAKANLFVKNEIKQTPFVSTFILYKNGNTL